MTKPKWFGLCEEEIVTCYIDGEISEMEAIRRIMKKNSCGISTAKYRFNLDIQTINS